MGLKGIRSVYTLTVFTHLYNLNACTLRAGSTRDEKEVTEGISRKGISDMTDVTVGGFLRVRFTLGEFSIRSIGQSK